MMSTALLFLAAVAVSSFQFSLGLDVTDCDFQSGLALELDDCDDCYTRAQPLRHGHVYMNGNTYGAFAISSNGHIVLLRNADSSFRRYSYAPQPLSNARGSPIIAGFWADVNLRCSSSSEENRVTYEETLDAGFMWIIHSLIDDPLFFPNSAVVVHYDQVQRFNCPRSAEENTFTIMIATDQSRRATYVLYVYDEMAWNRATSLSVNLPTIGYSDGAGRGFQAQLGSNPAASLSNGVLTYRIDEPFDEIRATAQVAVNKGNVALKQQKDSGEEVFMQHFQEKDDLKNDLALALEADDAKQQTSKEPDVVVQHFSEKKLN